MSTIHQIAEEQGKQVEQETEEAPGNLIVFDVRKLARFREEGPDVQVLSDIGTARLVLFAFKAGQQLKNIAPPASCLCRRCVVGSRLRHPATVSSCKQGWCCK